MPSIGRGGGKLVGHQKLCSKLKLQLSTAKVQRRNASSSMQAQRDFEGNMQGIMGTLQGSLQVLQGMSEAQRERA